ncbi:MAG TPA: SGNH/GDSL hydrolase family protein [Pseudonocardiaceae bacterium]|jgi:lysophospholipase L1-like esterase|nr:SGNH/GDSL hydrolase family protein [Pseudonocardiaceae bacterium]
MSRRSAIVSVLSVLSLLVAVAGLLSWPASAIAAAATPWTGSWAVAPQSSGTTFAQQTLRQIVHTSIGGSSARVHLSNVFGNQPLVVADVHIANSTSGSSVDGGSDRAVTFGGQATTTIPVGGSAVSDPISFTVGAQANVAVSAFLPQATGPATSHQLGLQNNFVASGDVSGSATLNNPQTIGSYYFLTNLDVQNTAATGAVVTLGASITDGVSSGTGDNRRWPNDLASRLLGTGRTVGVLNEGISGNQLLVDGAGQSALNRFQRDVVQQPNVRWVIFSDDPINDLGNPSALPSATQLINGLKQLIAAAHQANITFLCSTLTPAAPRSTWSAQAETEREQIDAFIRGAGSGCDGSVDQDTATHDPNNPTTYLPSFNSGDNLHPNETGLQAIANAVDLTPFGASTTQVISLRAHADNMIVTAENAGAAALIANRTAIGPWEQFDLVDEGSGNVALFAHADNQYVTAENAGASPLIANRTAVGLWETFALIHNPDGSVSLQAKANNHYVTAENAGASSLIANRTAIGQWEEFDLIHD